MSALVISQLYKTYANGKEALRGIDLTVQQGDFFALLGQNGAGKSTTIGIVSSLVTKTSGKVAVFGHDLDTNRDHAKQLIGVVPQEVNFMLYEKVSQILVNQAGYYGVPADVARKRMDLYLDEMGILEMRDQPAIRLSGGMKRRLLIARALMTEPKLLILDEPTAGVDIELRHTLWSFLKKLNANGTTIILTTHYLEEAENLCKNVAIISRGEIIENASMSNMMNRLTMQTVVLELATPLLTPLHLAEFPIVQISETALEVDINRGQTLNMLFTALATKNVTVINMRNKTNRLEELYIQLIKEHQA